MKNNARAEYALSFVLIAAIAICSGCSNIDTKDKINITYHTIESLPEQLSALQTLTDNFERENPGINVEIETAPSGTLSVFQKLKVRIAGQHPPDVFYMVTDRIDEYISRGAVMDITESAERDFPGLKRDYYPEVIESCYKNGKMYCFPFHFSTDLLFYNKDLFDAAGVSYPEPAWNWQDVLESALKLTQTGQNGVKTYGFLQPRPLFLMRSFGSELFTGKPLRCTIDDTRSKAALRFLIDLHSKYGVSPNNAVLNPSERSQSEMEMFKNGKAAMFIGRTYMLVDFAGIKRFKWDICSVPRGTKRYSRLAVGGNCISPDTKYPEASWKFIKYFSSREGTMVMTGKRNCVPALKSAAESEFFLHPPPENMRFSILQLSFSEAETYPVENWREFLEKEFSPAIDRIILGKTSIDNGLSELQEKGQKYISK
ncbi:sugar ABC transporter substrate-binding protein [bacterium]|jgi:multiple sugar transport system substrate-binding protein|nr:sugar ABC transporter substrate-binding protein [bacterium]